MCIRDRTSSDGNAIDLTKSQTSGSTATYDFPFAITFCPKPENIIVPAITEFLIIDLLEPFLFVKSLLKIDIKNDRYFKKSLNKLTNNTSFVLVS